MLRYTDSRPSGQPLLATIPGWQEAIAQFMREPANELWGAAGAVLA
jgi:hypothetical protein